MFCWCVLIYCTLIVVHFMSSRELIKGRARGKLTCCGQDLAINLPGGFRLLFLLSFRRKTKNVRLKTPTDLLHKNLMKPWVKAVYTIKSLVINCLGKIKWWFLLFLAYGLEGQSLNDSSIKASNNFLKCMPSKTFICVLYT